KLGLLPTELAGHPQPEIMLNALGDPYQLRKKALDHRLEDHELGRVLLHLVQRRGFLSNRKTLMSEMLDDPDVQAVLAESDVEDEHNASERAKDEKKFHGEIKALREKIKEKGCRTLGEYLAGLENHACKRNRDHDEEYFRTDRQMYRDELNLIWQEQAEHHAQLNDDVQEQIEKIIFYQRPLKLGTDRIGKCSLEPGRKRANMGRLEAQRFRYLQDINNMTYTDPTQGESQKFNADQRRVLIDLFEHDPKPTFKKIIKKLDLPKKSVSNLESDTKSLEGNLTACKIRKVLGDWDSFETNKQMALVEDLLTIKKKPVLKNRLVSHWGFDGKTAVRLCAIEFQKGHSRHCVKVINCLLDYLEKGQLYSEARQSAGYGYEHQKIKPVDRLGPSPDLPNPIVRKALSELKRLVNALIAEYGKPDAIRIEMARDLEMNTKRYQAYLKQQKTNTKANEEAVNAYQVMLENNPHLRLSRYPDRADKIRYRLWKDQQERCAYSGKTIPLSTLFSAEVDVDHILPYSQSLDDSYMNKVVCYVGENRNKGQRTPIDAFGGNTEKWEQITQAIRRWDKKLLSKKNRFYTTGAELQERDFINSQLNDTRYISREAKDYVKQLGVDVSVTKGHITAWLRHQWGLNTLIGDSADKDRSDHRHHAIDAVVIACVDRSFYQRLVRKAKLLEASQIGMRLKDLEIDEPWTELRSDLQNKLKDVIIAHTPQRKL
ncbi:MAG: type II CRISPR RNA-guided endonuclease Cas9, partial [Nitrospiria bacterium]